MKMKKILGMLCVMIVGSTAMGDYVADFDGWVSTDLDVAPWQRVGPNVIVGDTPNLGLNPTDRVQIGGSSFAWLEPEEADQFAQGTLEFDLMLSGIAPGWPNLILYLSDDDVGAQGVWLRIASETGAGGNDLDLFVYDPGVSSGSVVLTDFMTRDAWYTMKIDFDLIGESYDVSLDNSIVLNDEPVWGAVPEINRIAWQNSVGFYTQIDNVSLIPEPGSLALLGIGAFLLTRFRKRTTGVG